MRPMCLCLSVCFSHVFNVLVRTRVTVVFVLLTIYFFPTKASWKWICNLSLFYRLFPPKIKLLTEEEYILQGSEETKKALAELREYCK